MTTDAFVEAIDAAAQAPTAAPDRSRASKSRARAVSGAGDPVRPAAERAGATDWRFRIVEHADVDPLGLIEHPDNFKAHPEYQGEMLLAAIAEVGFIGEVYVSKRSNRILDGHERVALAIRAHQPLVPVGYIDCADDNEELRILATYDPIGTLARTDAIKLEAAARRGQLGSDPLLVMLSRISGTKSRETPQGRVIGAAFGPQGGGPARGGHVGKLPTEVWPIVIECTDELHQLAVYEQLQDEELRVYLLEPGPSSLAEDRRG